MAWTTPRTWVVGEVLTASLLNTHLRDNLDFIDARTLGLASSTTVQTGIGSAYTDVTGLSVGITAGTSRRVRILVACHIRQQTSSGLVSCAIREGSTTLNVGLATESAGSFGTVHALHVLTPSAGAHTYKVSLSTTAGTVEHQPDGASGRSSIIHIEDAGRA